MPTTVRIPIPLVNSEWAALEVSMPMTEANWQLMLAVLDVMKRGLVAPEGDGAAEVVE